MNFARLFVKFANYGQFQIEQSGDESVYKSRTGCGKTLTVKRSDPVQEKRTSLDRFRELNLSHASSSSYMGTVAVLYCMNSTVGWL